MATVGESMRETGYFGDVRSRIHWGPILGGVAVAFAVYFLLTLFGIAIGLTAVEPGEQLGTGTALWSVVAIIVALFIGGMVTTRCAIGEDRVEAMLYGAIVWGVTFVLFMWLMAVGLSAGFDIFMGSQAMQRGNGQAAQPQAAAPAAQAQGQQAQQQAQQPVAAAAQAVDQETAAAAAWWAFVGVLLSIIASIGGAVVGQNTAEGRRHRLGRQVGTTPVAG